MNWLEMSPGRGAIGPPASPCHQGERQVAGVSRFCNGALLSQCLQKGLEGPPPQLRRRIHGVAALACGAGRQQKARRGARLSALYLRLGDGDAAAGPAHLPFPGFALRDCEAQGAKTAGERQSVAGTERTPEGRCAVGQGGQQERAVGDALGAGYPHARIEILACRVDEARMLRRVWCLHVPMIQRRPLLAAQILKS